MQTNKDAEMLLKSKVGFTMDAIDSFNAISNEIEDVVSEWLSLRLIISAILSCIEENNSAEKKVINIRALVDKCQNEYDIQTLQKDSELWHRL